MEWGKLLVVAIGEMVKKISLESIFPITELKVWCERHDECMYL